MNNCAPWSGSVRGKGYGQAWCPIRKRQVGAHVLAWEAANGRLVEKGEMVRHSCDTPICVNPEHLLIGNNSDNVRDAVARGRHNTGWMKRSRNQRGQFA